MKYFFVIALCVLGAQALPSTFIVNGNDATEVVPHHVHIQIERIAEIFTLIGSGVIILPNIVLTVAQNVAGFTRWECGMGSTNKNNLHWIGVDLAVTHNDYDPTTLSNNIALLRLASNVVSPAAPIASIFPDNVQPSANSVGIVSGWGFTSWPPTIANPNPSTPDILQVSQQIVIDQNECAKVYPHLNTLDQHFCAYSAASLSGFCAGDQGGGMFTNLFGNDVLFGIKSFIREEDCSVDAPNAYIRTSFFYPWIDSNANDLISSPKVVSKMEIDVL